MVFKFIKELMSFLFCEEQSELRQTIDELRQNLQFYKNRYEDTIKSLEGAQQLLVDFIDKENIDFKERPSNWTEVEEDIVTKKHYVFGDTKNVPVDVRDLLQTSYLTRKLAKEIITKNELTKDSSFYEILLACQNKINVLIKYESNQLMYGIIDVWNNGDLTLLKQKGDCDLTTRVFVRVCNDVLNKLKKTKLKKYLFQTIGVVRFDDNEFGHSWVEIYNPEDKKWYLIETTEDVAFPDLRGLEKNYIKEFCLNIYKVYKQKETYERFL